MADLNVRVINRNDTLANWTSKNPVLAKGEIALASVDTWTSDGTLVPTYLMKVGDGTKTFSALKWLAAPASDVYGWAKLENPSIDELPANLKTAIKNLQSAVGEGGSVADSITAAINKLNKADAAVTGQFVTAVTEENGIITVTRAALAASDIPALGIDKITGLADRLTGIEEDVADNADAIAKEVQDRGAAIDTLTSTVEQNKKAADTGIQEAKTAASTAQAAAEAAQGDVDALEGVVSALDATVAANKTAAEQAVAGEKTARENADSALDGRIASIESVIGGVTGAMHFIGAHADAPATGKDGDVYVNTTNHKEFVYSDGAWVELGDVTEEAQRISALETFKNTTVPATYETIANADLVRDRVSTLETDIATKATQTDLDTAEAAIEANADAIDALETTVGDANSGLVKKVADLETNIPNTYVTKTDFGALEDKVALDADLDALATRVTENEKDISALQGSVATKAEAEALAALTTRVDTAEDDITTANTNITALGGRVDTIETNFAKVVDGTLMYGDNVIVIKCGDASSF